MLENYQQSVDSVHLPRVKQSSNRTRMQPIKPHPTAAYKCRGDSVPISRWFEIIVLLVVIFCSTGHVGVEVAANKRAASEINLDFQMLDSIPVQKLCQYGGEEPEIGSDSHWNQVNAVSLANNRIEALEANSFTCVALVLRILVLSNNQISRISPLAFGNLEALQVLSLDNNRLESVPSIDALSPLKSLKHINLAGNRITFLPSNSFGPASANLISLNLGANPLKSVASDALIHLAKLKTLTLSQTSPSARNEPELELELPLLLGLNELRFYHLDRLDGNLTHVPADLCSTSAKLSSLVLKSNKLAQVPQFNHCQSLLQLDLSYNEIKGTLEANFSKQTNLIDLYLSHNQLELIGEQAFSGLKQLQVLDLSYNKLIQIKAGAFLPTRSTLRDLSIANNPHLSRFDALGLERLISFKSYGNPQLRSLPRLPSARHLALTFAYHCCDYLTRETLSWREKLEVENASLLGQLLESMLRKLGFGLGSDKQKAPNGVRADNQSMNLSESILWPLTVIHVQELEEAENLQSQARGSNHQRQLITVIDDEKIRCLPEPSAFLPCEDLFDSWWLRAGIWLVFPLAFAGNILVIIVLSSVRQSSSTSALASIMWLSRSKRHIDVPRFLVINLAIADLMMALYLGILAFVDLSTIGEFRLFAIKWQYSSGCKLAGFLGVLSSELSVFILAIITLERNYAITNAVHLNRRLSLHKAILIMLIGYVYALTMALMPLNGISDYRKFSICLPLDTTQTQAYDQITSDSSNTSRIYLITLISINTFSFILLLGCYLRMYCAIRGSQAWNTNDLRIAKRMSILVITDFLCWMPIICFAVASLFGHQLIGAHGLKVLAIFVLPLNSVANPFLYAITTKKFKRDLDILLGRIRSSTNFIKCPDCIRGDASGDFDPKSRAFHQLAFSNTNHHNYRVNKSNGKHKKLFKSHTTLAATAAVKPRAHKGGAEAGGCGECCCCCCCNHAKHNPSKHAGCRHGHRFNVANMPLITANHFATINRTSCSIDNLAAAAAAAAAGHIDSTPSPTLVMQNEKILHPTDIPQVQIKFERNSSTEVGNEERDNLAQQTFAHLASCQTILAASNSNHLRYKLASAQNNYTRSVEPNVRSVSACGYRCSPDKSLAPATDKHRRPVSCSCEAAVGDEQTIRSRTRSIQRLLFDPLAKAWSSVQISSMSSASPSTTGTQSFISSAGVGSQVMAVYAQETGSHHNQISSGNEKSNTTEDVSALFDGSPNARHLQLRINERRMSRSCDYIISDHTTQTISELTTTTSGDDDQKVLLSKSRFQPDRMMNQTRSFRKRCTRCRSWSPALLSKLEECIYRVRSRIPGLRTETEESRESIAVDCSVGVSNTKQTGERQVKIEEDAPEISDAHLQRQQARARLQRQRISNKRRRLFKQESSANSDSFSTRTGATIMTNMSVSFDDDDDNGDSSPEEQSDNIPLSIEDVIDEKEPQ